MATILTNQASFQRAFYRLTNTDSTDEALIEQDTSGDLEAVNQFLQYGVDTAQDYLIDAGLTERWIKQATAITSFSGTEAADGGRFKDLESDFRRLAGDDNNSALREITGTRWGREINFRDRFRVRGNKYWLQNDQLWIARGSSPPTSLIYDYIFRIPALSSSTIDFPTEDRYLIVAYAGQLAKEESWLPGGAEMETKIDRSVIICERRAFRRGRRTRTARRLRPKQTVGTHWML